MMEIKYEILMPVKGNQPVSFRFEEDFVEQNVRCIPMIVRFKLDITGIKLTLTEWSKFNIQERQVLINKSCITADEVSDYRSSLKQLILEKTSNEATELPEQEEFLWWDLENIAAQLQEKAKSFGCTIAIDQWRSLNNLQRFALLKLCRAGHENINFQKAMKEFGLM